MGRDVLRRLLLGVLPMLMVTFFFFVRAPKVVEALRGVKVVGVAAGTEHMLCVTDAGVVYAWGSNTKGCCGVTQGVLTPSTPAKVVSTRGNPITSFLVLSSR